MMVWHKTFCQLHFERLGERKKRKERLLLTQAWNPEAGMGVYGCMKLRILDLQGPWPLQAGRWIHLPPDEGEASPGLESMQ